MLQLRSLSSLSKFLAVAAFYSRCVVAGIQDGQARQKTLMVPGVHWDHDVESLEHLLPKKNLTLFYIDQTVSDTHEWARTGYAKGTYLYPAVAIHHSIHINSVECRGFEGVGEGSSDPNWALMTLTFQNYAALKYAHKHWEQGSMIFIGDKDQSPGCKGIIGDQGSHRFWALASRFRWPPSRDLSIRFPVYMSDVRATIDELEFTWGEEETPSGKRKRDLEGKLNRRWTEVKHRSTTAHERTGPRRSKRDAEGRVANMKRQSWDDDEPIKVAVGASYFTFPEKYNQGVDPETGINWNDTELLWDNNVTDPRPAWLDAAKAHNDAHGPGNLGPGLSDDAWLNRDGTPYVNTTAPPSNDPTATNVIPSSDLSTFTPGPTGTEVGPSGTPTPTPSSNFDLGNNPNGYISLFSLFEEDKFIVGSSRDGNLYLVDPASVVAGESANWNLFMAADNGVTMIDANGRFFIMYQREMEAFGASRLRMHKLDDIPKSGIVVNLYPIAMGVQEGRGGPLLAFSSEETGYYMLAACDYKDDQKVKLFIVKDPEEGIKRLNNPSSQNVLTGGVVSKCKLVGVTNGFIGFDMSQSGLDIDEY